MNLSDGVFAIALTLLVLGLELPDAGGGSMSEQLRGRLPNLIAFMGVFLALIGSAQSTGAWREAPNPRLFRWVIAGWWAELAGLLLALLVALVVPLAGLALAALKAPLIAAFMSRRAPPGYADWA